jgi:hypothetical protein
MNIYPICRDCVECFLAPMDTKPKCYHFDRVKKLSIEDEENGFSVGKAIDIEFEDPACAWFTKRNEQ